MGELFEKFVQHVFDLRSLHSGGSDFNGDAARAEGLGFEAVECQFIGNLGKDRLLRRGEFEQQRHEQALAFHFLGGPLLEDFFEEHALVGDVLIDDPETFVIDGQDERLANLAQRLERRQGRSQIAVAGSRFWFVGDRRSAAIFGDRLPEAFARPDMAALASTEIPSMPNGKRSVTGGGTGACSAKSGAVAGASERTPGCRIRSRDRPMAAASRE